jgi:hypothetical protein
MTWWTMIWKRESDWLLQQMDMYVGATFASQHSIA